MGKKLELTNSGSYSGMVPFVMRFDTGSLFYKGPAVEGFKVPYFHLIFSDQRRQQEDPEFAQKREREGGQTVAKNFQISTNSYW